MPRLYLTTLIMILPAALLAANGVEADLQSCSSIEEANSRLACYDSLSGRKPAKSAVIVAPVSQAPAAPVPASPPSEGEAPVIARVTECIKDVRKKYVFRLDNGQVWKQVSDKRLYFKECDFDVTISKDFFGYKMQQEGEKSRFRVSRVR